MANVTDLKLRKMKPGEKAISHGGIPGLMIVPSKTVQGHGKWVLRYISPITKKRRSFGLGTYPEISIREAATNALEQRKLVESGLDPIDEKNKLAIEQERIHAIPTFEEAALTCFNELKSGWKNAKHTQQWINTLKTYVFPYIGRYKLDEITPRLVADALRDIWQSKPETASRTKQRVHTVMAWGWAQEFCNGNPVDVVDRLLPKQPSKIIRTENQPAMPWRMIPKFIEDNINLENDYITSTEAALLFAILTAGRSGEIRGTTWDEIDFEKGIWCIQAKRMKMKLPHRVPLSDFAIKVLLKMQGIDSKYVFPSPRKKGMLSDATLTKYLRDHKAPSNTPNRYATLHGFRSSFRDWCSENGYSRDLAERALAHTIKNQTEAAYHRTDLLEQRRLLMENWGDYIFSDPIPNFV